MKKYIPKPGQPTPTPAPGGDKPPRYKPLPVKPGPGKNDGRVEVGGPGWRDINPPRRRKPEPKPKPRKPGDDLKTIMPVPRKKKKSVGVKRRDVSNEQLAPRRIKPTSSRRRFLDELNEMNKKSR